MNNDDACKVVFCLRIFPQILYDYIKFIFFIFKMKLFAKCQCLYETIRHAYILLKQIEDAMLES